MHGLTHVPPVDFSRGASVGVRLQIAGGSAVARVVLRYRQVDQSRSLESLDLSVEDGCAHGEIPASYTDSDFPLMYFFEVYGASGALALVPGLDQDLANQPYWVLRTGSASA